ECYVLLPVGEAGAEDLPGPVGVLLPLEERCDVCDGPLIALFDVDLTEPRLSFLAAGWDRLRIPICERCTGYGELVTGWDCLPPPGRLVVGPRRGSPFEAHDSVLYMGDFASQLGGFPMWVGSEPHPDCRKCHRTMLFVGQLQVDDLYQEIIEGVIYAF